MGSAGNVNSSGDRPGIDNIIFISILVGRLPENQRNFARRMGLSLAMLTRLGLLFSISWVMGLYPTVVHLLDKVDFRAGSSS